ncbi:MAG TPA: hypothetical protein PLF26_21475, partial [Blastocatellia bacterium]|nr:hypothetical protein [Blastocatellia bacterium]
MIDQYDHTTEPYWTYDPNTGQPDGPFSESNGLSATVFQNVATGERVLAIRGTSDIHDVITDVVDVFTLGSTRNQGQYLALRDKVQQWIAGGVLPQHFPVTGHSLGGFLATGLALEFPQHVDHAYLYNTPGLGGLTSRPVLDEIARVYHIAGGSFDPSRFSNVRAKPGTSLISGFGTPLSAPILVEGEDHGGLFIGTANHSIKYLVDSLAVYDALDWVSDTDARERIGTIVRGAGVSPLGKLEATLDSLRAMLLGGSLPRTAHEDRESLHANLIALTDSAAHRTLFGQAQLTPTAQLGLRALAGDPSAGLAALTALRFLSPFRLGGVEGALASANPALAVSLAHDAALTRQRLLVDADYSDAWRADRARMLKAMIGRAESDGAQDVARRIPVSRRYDDRGDAIVLDTRPGDRRVAPVAQVTFGKEDASNTIVAGSSADALYGGFQADTLDGGAGDDRIEGR